MAKRDQERLNEQVFDYVERELPDTERRALEDHMRNDQELRQRVEMHREVNTLLRGVIGKRSISSSFTADTGMRMQGVAPSEFDTSAVQDAVDGYEPLVPPAPSFLDELQARMGSAPWWLISGAFHALLLALVTLIGLAIMRNTSPDAVIVTDLQKREELKPPEDPKERTIIPQKVDMPEQEVVTDEPQIVTHEEVEISDHVETADDSDFAETRGEDGVSDVFLGGSGTVAALGLGGGGGGAFGRPGGRGGRLRRAIRGGGGKATESAVDKALEWLARNQEPDGHWDIKKHGAGMSGDMGVTGLALLAFLGAGHTEKIGKYKENVKRAVSWIIKCQDAKGALRAPDNPTEKIRKKGHTARFEYGQAISAMALAEASAMARVPATRAAAQKAVNYATEVMQGGKNSDKKYWDYGKPPDMSINGWFIMMLKSAKVGGLHVNPASFDGAISFLDLRMADAVNVKKGGDSSYDNGGHRYGYRDKKPMLNTTAMGVLCRLFTGSPPQEVRGAAQWMLRSNPPAWKAELGKGAFGCWPMYYAYYGTLTLFQVGGDDWRQWNDHLKKMLIPTQRRGGDEDGSWDPLGEAETRTGGRVYSTALGALCLEVYYRYLPMYR